MKYDQALKFLNALKSGVQVKHLSASEYVMYINLKRKLNKYFEKVDGAGQELINDYNKEKEVVMISDGILICEDQTFFDKLKAIRDEEVELDLNFIEKIEVFKSVFENCPTDQELLYELLFKTP